jgi:hypothetical protein
MAVWPGALPDRFLVNGYREAMPESTIRTQMDAGPPKLRRRYTAAYRPIQGRIECNASQLAALDTFFVTTCANGALPFDWINSRTGAAATFQWRGAPMIEPNHSDSFFVSLDLLQVP